MSQEKKSLSIKDNFGAGSSLSKRKFFNKRIMVSLPNLIEVQLDSFMWFWEKGLKELLVEVNPM